MRRQIVTRRQFLRGTGTAAGVALLGAPLFDVGTALAAPPFVRYDIGSLSPSSPIIVSYSKAIGAMKALPPGDPRSWSYQAAIHGTTAMPIKMAWNTCEHGTYFFWSWHRMYIYWFERIVRKMSGNPGWTLPFWNWSSPTERQLPAVFRDPTSELYTPNRKPAMNSGAGSLPPSDVNYGGAFSLSNFASASSSLEGTPHGTVHVDVGGWMGSVPTAAQDPIFYLHHCNIDRLWSLWLTLGGTRSNPLSDGTWKDTQFTFFDENAAPVKMTSCDVLRAAQQLSYTYKGEPPQVNQNCVRVAKVPRTFKRETLLHLPIPPVVLDAEPVSFNFDIKPLRRQLASAASSRTQTVFLELDDVEADRPPGVVWEVYVGLPAKAEPDPKSVYYVGNVVLFGSGIKSEGHEFKPAHFALPISKAILSLLRQPKDQVPVTFVAHDILIDGKLTRPKPESPVRIGRVSLTVETQSGP